MRNEAETAFIRQHLDDDLHRLVLSRQQYTGVDVAAMAAQIEALRKIKDKAPSWYLPSLQMPAMLSVEQASSERTGMFKARLFSGNAMADLTGGMGIDSWCFAQRFSQVYCVEQQAALAQLDQYNFGILGADNIEVFNQTAESFLQTFSQPLDLIYLDPARRDEASRRVYRLEDCSPNVLENLDLLLQKAPRVLLKTAPMLDVKAAIQALGAVSRIWIVALRDEVKEVLYLLEPTAASAISLCCVNLDSTQPDFPLPWRRKRPQLLSLQHQGDISTSPMLRC
ncbi:MAG: hypothetical protein IPL65_19610 [Lewinellaceae bacterium]|nr:hypothetical protein [Lewinellaceae bacterium]